MSYCCVAGEGGEGDKQGGMALMRQEQEVNERLCSFDKYIPVMQVVGEPAFQFYRSSSPARVAHGRYGHKNLRVIITIIETLSAWRSSKCSEPVALTSLR